MRLQVFACGKLKDPALERWVHDYCRRSQRFLPIEVRHLRNMQSLRGQWSDKERVWLLDERGRNFSSPQLAESLGAQRDRGTREIRLLIGDADGFSDADRKRADLVLSLSSLTLPHRLALVLLVEQLYRAGTILAGHPYHHEG